MMQNHFTRVLPLLCSLLMLPFALGCSSSSNPLAAFQPEIRNNPDVANVSTTVEYLWQNSGQRVTLNQSSVITGGSATLKLFSPDMVERYSASLSSNGTFQSDTATAGSWRIRVILTNVSGTLNFRAQKL
jgi:hypothetical protein